MFFDSSAHTHLVLCLSMHTHSSHASEMTATNQRRLRAHFSTYLSLLLVLPEKLSVYRVYQYIDHYEGILFKRHFLIIDLLT